MGTNWRRRFAQSSHDCMHPSATKTQSCKCSVSCGHTECWKAWLPSRHLGPPFSVQFKGETCRERSITIVHVSPRLKEAMHVHGPPPEYSGGLLACLLRAARSWRRAPAQLVTAAGGGITREEKKRCMPRPLTLTENLLSFLTCCVPFPSKRARAVLVCELL